MRTGAMHLICALFILIALPAWAQIVRVGLEPFPPLITEEGKGYSVEMLRAIEQESDLKFQIEIMPYNRARIELKEGKLDMIGHTPQGEETTEFYGYAQELNWGIGGRTDIYGMDKDLILHGDLKSIKPIGTPRGNEEFFSNLFGIPLANFHTGNLDNLIPMLKLKRIDAFIFERASTMSTINKLMIKDVYYRMINDSLRASFAVRKDEQGNILKKKLDDLITRTDTPKIYSGYYHFLNMPKEGKVPAE